MCPGTTGQWMFCLLMKICHGRNAPYFRPRFLGDTFPSFGYLVELVGNDAYFFFVQVKCTRQGYARSRGHVSRQPSSSAHRETHTGSLKPSPHFFVRAAGARLVRNHAFLFRTFLEFLTKTAEQECAANSLDQHTHPVVDVIR